jgi:hypothetical protein
VDTTAWEQEVTKLVAKAEIGQTTWEAVAMLEKAHMGLVTYNTYKQMTPQERARMGRINQTTARTRLGLPLGKP